jgi:adenosylhomocysteine nucleosidase
MTERPSFRVAVLISADVEWRVIRALFPQLHPAASPYGEWFVTELDVGAHCEPVLFFHGGWGKVAAAASTQYVIDRWSPALLVNLGTCGGFEGEIEKGTVVLVERTIVYDIIEQMGDHDEHIAHYTTEMDLSWLGEDTPHDVIRTLLVSGDRDLLPEDIPLLKDRYGAVAGDWESGAIAWVASRNQTRCLILRGVTDLVGSSSGEAYGNIALFVQNAAQVLGSLVESLPAWITSLDGSE